MYRVPEESYHIALALYAGGTDNTEISRGGAVFSPLPQNTPKDPNPVSIIICFNFQIRR
jgi:hypothetical protein